MKFPFLFGRAFIEALRAILALPFAQNFPSFSEGLSLRPAVIDDLKKHPEGFPFLFGRAFIEAAAAKKASGSARYFPSFSEGLSLRCADRQLVARNVQYFFAF